MLEVSDKPGVKTIECKQIIVNTFLRTLTSLLIVLWLGGVLFFPVLAKTAFDALPHPQAGLVVRHCLLILHREGLGAGVLLLVLLPVSGATRAYGSRVIGPVLCTLAMLGLTVFSQFSVMPRMEADRIAVGGDIDKASAENPHRVEFDRLHAASEELEEGVLGAGIAMVVLLAREGKPRPGR